MFAQKIDWCVFLPAFGMLVLKHMHIETRRENQTQISSIVTILWYNYIRDEGTEAERDGVTEIDGWD